MLEWIKNITKEYPEFWKKYISKFEKKSSRYVILSVETSGLNPAKDVIFSFGAIAVVNNAIVISDTFETVLMQYTFIHDNQLSNEFIIESKQPKLGEREAIEALIDYIGSSILVGHRIHYYVDMINVALEKMECGRLKNEALDIEIMQNKLLDSSDKKYSVDEIAHYFKLPQINRISTSDDAYSIALIFLKLKSRLKL